MRLSLRMGLSLPHTLPKSCWDNSQDKQGEAAIKADSQMRFKPTVHLVQVG